MTSHLKALSTILLYVKDPAASANFYEKLGLQRGLQSNAMVQVTLGAVAITLLDQAKAEFQQDTPKEPKGAGVFFLCQVDDVDAYHQELLTKGLQPSSEPRTWPWGNREFVIKDPDGYKIVFWQKVS